MKSMRALVPGLIVFALTSGAMMSGGCLGTGQCDALRVKLLDQRNTWAACDPSQGDEACAVAGGDETDCTGVFRCAFAVNVTHRSDAEKAVIANASQAVECAAVCSSPACSQSTVARCDATLKRCVIDFVGGGTGDDGGGEPDAGIPDTYVPPPKDSGEGGTL